MKRLQPRHYIYVLLFLLIIGCYAGIFTVWHHQRAEIRMLNSQIMTVNANQSASQGSNYNDVTIIPSERAVYLPLAKIKLPDNNLTEGLVYSYTAGYTVSGVNNIFPANLSLSTHDLAANASSTTQQFDCAEVVYADFVTPSYPTNPTWKTDGSVKLTDGRTMNVYYAPSIPGCQRSWQFSNVDSKAIADSLKDATSY